MAYHRTVYVVDDDTMVRRSLVFLLRTARYEARPYVSGSDLLDDLPDIPPGVVLLDIRMPGVDGLEVIERMTDWLDRFPVVAMTGHGDVSTAVAAMKHGATDFLEKPFDDRLLIDTLEGAFSDNGFGEAQAAERQRAREQVDELSARERQVLQGLLSGLPNKLVARELDLSVRTVEMHRANMMRRLDVKSLPDALRLAILADVRPLIAG